MQKQRRKSGFSLAEMLVVVAIIAILGGVVFINVINYQRSMAQFERDNIAKEIFVSAQNHLTMVEGQGYLGMTGAAFGATDDQGAYYYIVDSVNTFSNNPTRPASTLDLMLPFASVDETVRLNGSYIIRYQTNPALVLDVFYCSDENTRFGHKLTSSEYDTVRELRGEENKEARRIYDNSLNDKSVIGWYGGDGLNMAGMQEPPSVRINNKERLTVEIRSPINSNTTLYLQVRGQTSGALKTFTLTSSTDPRVEDTGNVGTQRRYIVTLDNITLPNMHFSDLAANPGSEQFIPGEDIVVWAEISSNVVSIPGGGAISTTVKDNSLFANHTTSNEALIDNIRHLENLDKSISNVSDNGSAIKITKAKQINDLYWKDDDLNTDDFVTTIGGTVKIYKYRDLTGTESFIPVNSRTLKKYDGQEHAVSSVIVNATEKAGMFGEIEGTSLNPVEVLNLQLINFSVTTSTGDAGALAGSITNGSVSNVVAYNNKSYPATDNINITESGSGSAGGLIGSASSTNVTYSAAALYVNSPSGNAGGLIGTSTSGTISASYSGGHTYQGGYYDAESHPIYNVKSTSGSAGGLVGNAGTTMIDYSYSTCSVSGTTAGGLAGTASGEIKTCYCTGLVEGTTKGAFLGSQTGGSTDGCYYFESINMIPDPKDSKKTTYLSDVGQTSLSVNDMKPVDSDTTTYQGFFDQQPQRAIPYDNSLTKNYGGKYPLKTVYQLAYDNLTDSEREALARSLIATTHYGDWPKPAWEVFFVNEPA